MTFHFALLLLAPVLLLQGKYVRWKVPKLPEPVGARTGDLGHGPDLRVLIVGDSAAAGVGVEQQSHALSGRLVAGLSGYHHVHWTLLAETGDTSAQLLSKLGLLDGDPFDVAVVSIGVNDVTSLTRRKRWRKNLTAIIRILLEKHRIQQVYLSSLPPMHLFPALPNPLRWWLGLRAAQLSVDMASVSNTNNKVFFVSTPFSGHASEIASDGFHPGLGAYATWGQYMASQILDNAGKLQLGPD